MDPRLMRLMQFLGSKGVNTERFQSKFGGGGAPIGGGLANTLRLMGGQRRNQANRGGLPLEFGSPMSTVTPTLPANFGTSIAPGLGGTGGPYGSTNAFSAASPGRPYLTPSNSGGSTFAGDISPVSAFAPARARTSSRSFGRF